MNTVMGNGRDKLREIIPVPGIWIDKERCTRRDEVVINRVRIGHTLLTHGYLMNDDVPDVAPHCKLCNSAILTIKHIMLECEQLSNARQDCLKMCRHNRAPTLRKKTYYLLTIPVESSLY